MLHVRRVVYTSLQLLHLLHFTCHCHWEELQPVNGELVIMKGAGYQMRSTTYDIV